MSEKESNLVINELKREINNLKTELMRSKLLSNCYKKYFDYFNEINKTFEELFDLKDNIKFLKEGNKTCVISVEKLKENQLNQLSSQTIVENIETSTQTKVFTEIEVAENSNVLSAEEVSDNDSEGIDCDFNYTNLSNDETIDAIIDERENPIKSEENVIKPNSGSNESLGDIQLNLNIKNEIRSEVNEEEVQNHSQILIKNVKSLRSVGKPKHDLISCESEENGIKFNVNSDNEVDYELNGEQMCNNSEEYSDINRKKTENIDKIIKYSKKNEYKCGADGCGYYTKSKCDLNRHKSRIHSKEKPFICSVKRCDKRFSWESDLRSHKRRTHKMNVFAPRFVCEDPGCGKLYKCEYNLRQHMKMHSNGGYKCQSKYCSAVFYLKKDFVKHMIEHKKEDLQSNHKTKLKN